jgi:hypothetical protein
MTAIRPSLAAMTAFVLAAAVIVAIAALPMLGIASRVLA